MKTYNSKEISWANLRSRRTQIQKYIWTNIDKNFRWITLELRPTIPVGFIHQIKIYVPQATNFDTYILNKFEDSTSAYISTIHQIASWSGSNTLLHDSNIGPAQFISGYKTMKNEKEALHRPDGTTEPEPVLALVIERNSGSGDSTTIEAEIWIEGQFPPDDKRNSSLVAKRWNRS